MKLKFNTIFKFQPKPDKRRDDISEKLKELTGDWTEDENEDEEETVKTVNPELGAAQEQSEVKESVEVGDVAGKEATEEQPEPEDDIDLALESMHKGDDDVTETVEAIATSSTAEVRHDEEPEVESGATTEEQSSNIEAAVKVESVANKIEKEQESQNEFIKEEALQTAATLDTEIEGEAETEIKTAEETEETTAAETSTTNVEDVNLETENIRKVLIDELIAEAEAPEADVAAEQSATQPPVADDTDTLKDNDVVPTVEDDKASDQTKKLTEEATAIETTVEDSSADASNEKESEKPAATSDEAGTTLDGKAQAEQQLTGTQEKVKSLISEWADDDDDDNDNDDENGVSAAAKEQL